MAEQEIYLNQTPRKYNREYQRNAVIQFLVRKEPLDFVTFPLTVGGSLFDDPSPEGYLAFLYRVKDAREYEEGFGPSVNVRVGADDTIWKRSRNKWNPFEKIKTLDDADSETAFTVMWDRNHSNSFYVTERMYYYLDREKHKDKYKTIRAKLYITRLHQKGGDNVFLLQFIMERLTDDELDSLRMKEEKKRKKTPDTKRLSDQSNTRSSPYSSGPSSPYSPYSTSPYSSSPSTSPYLPPQLLELANSSPGNRTTFPPPARNPPSVIRPVAIKPAPPAYPYVQGYASMAPMPSVPSMTGSMPTPSMSSVSGPSYGQYLQPPAARPPGVPSLLALSQYRSQPGSPRLQSNRTQHHVKARSMDNEPRSRWNPPGWSAPGMNPSSPESMVVENSDRSSKRRSLELDPSQISDLTLNSPVSSIQSSPRSPLGSSPTGSPPVGGMIQQPYGFAYMPPYGGHFGMMAPGPSPVSPRIAQVGFAPYGFHQPMGGEPRSPDAMVVESTNAAHHM